jgi:hypothetical protein
MASVSRLPWRQIVVVLLIFGGGCPGSLPAARSAEAQTLHGIQSDRNRVMLGFRAKPEIIQEWLPSLWQLDPVQKGPLQGANFFVVMVDRIRDDDPEGNPRSHGADQIIHFAVPAKHPQTGQTVSVILSGWASNAARKPGFFQVYRPASIWAEQIIKSQDGDAEEVSDIWEVRDAAGQGGMALQLQSRRLLSARTRARGEVQAISTKGPAVAQRHQFDAVADVIKSLPDGVDRVQHYAFRLDRPEFSPLFDGSEQLIGISVTHWYVRQVFTP